MRYRLLPVLTALFLFLWLAPVAAQDRVDEFVLRMIQEGRIPGLALAVLRDGEVIKVASYGVADRARGTAMTPDTGFKIGSVSKQFIATGVMLLVQDGRVRLDDPIGRFIDGIPDAWRPITVRHLLTHSSGLVREGPAYDDDIVQPDMAVISSAYDVPLVFAPGERTQYSNLGYFILAEIITRVSERPWDQFIQSRVFAPAGLTATTTTRMVDRVSRMARGYSDNDRLVEAAPEPALRPSGAFISTVLDLAKWDAVLLTNAVLTEATRQQMWTRVTLNNGNSDEWGMGWQVSQGANGRLVYHGGAITGFLSQFLRFVDRGLSVIVLMNLDDANRDGIAFGIANLYLSQPAVSSAPAN
jgi:CubicO group peptidase (beta-lactamase class C family)